MGVITSLPPPPSAAPNASPHAHRCARQVDAELGQVLMCAPTELSKLNSAHPNFENAEIAIGPSTLDTAKKVRAPAVPYRALTSPISPPTCDLP